MIMRGEKAADLREIEQELSEARKQEDIDAIDVRRQQWLDDGKARQVCIWARMWARICEYVNM